jgi:hypothetical protein
LVSKLEQVNLIGFAFGLRGEGYEACTTALKGPDVAAPEAASLQELASAATVVV